MWFQKHLCLEEDGVRPALPVMSTRSLNTTAQSWKGLQLRWAILGRLQRCTDSIEPYIWLVLHCSQRCHRYIHTPLKVLACFDPAQRIETRRVIDAAMQGHFSENSTSGSKSPEKPEIWHHLLLITHTHPLPLFLPYLKKPVMFATPEDSTLQHNQKTHCNKSSIPADPTKLWIFLSLDFWQLFIKIHWGINVCIV